MRADYEQLPEVTGYHLKVVFNEDEEQGAEIRRRTHTRGHIRDDNRGDPNEPRSQFYYEDHERREYLHFTPQPCRMTQSTKLNYTRWIQPASIEDEVIPEGEDSDNPNYTPS